MEYPEQLDSIKLDVQQEKNFEAICIEKIFESLYANSNNPRAIGLVELLIQTIKRRHSCMKAHFKKI